MRIAKNTKFFANSSLGIVNVFSTYLNFFFNKFSINLKYDETSIGHFMKIHCVINFSIYEKYYNIDFSFLQRKEYYCFM